MYLRILVHWQGSGMQNFLASYYSPIQLKTVYCGQGALMESGARYKNSRAKGNLLSSNGLLDFCVSELALFRHGLLGNPLPILVLGSRALFLQLDFHLACKCYF